MPLPPVLCIHSVLPKQVMISLCFPSSDFPSVKIVSFNFRVEMQSFILNEEPGYLHLFHLKKKKSIPLLLKESAEGTEVHLIPYRLPAQGLKHPSWGQILWSTRIKRVLLREGMRLLNFSSTLKFCTVVTNTVCYHQHWKIFYTKKELQGLIQKNDCG